MIMRKMMIANRYRVQELLASGGQGKIYTAQDTKANPPCKVAVKVCEQTATDTPGAADRFLREAIAAQKARSPNTVEILDFGNDDGLLFLVMPLLDGEDLGRKLLRVNKLSLDDLAKLVRDVSTALMFAHDAGFVHRDIKPSNVYEQRGSAGGRWIVLDFGIAKEPLFGVDGRLTKTGLVVGTLRYASPEQIRCSSLVDARSDIWSFGVMLFEALVGKHPFGQQSPVQIAAAVCNPRIPIPKPSELAPELKLPAAMDAFFARCLDRDPARRFRSASEMAEAFDDATAGRFPRRAPRTTVPSLVGDDALTIVRSLAPPPPSRRALGLAARVAWSVLLPAATALGALHMLRPVPVTAATREANHYQQVEIVPVPEDARIVIDGKPLSSPIVKIEPGKVVAAEISSPGYRTTKVDINGQKRVLVVRLRPDREALNGIRAVR